MLTALEVGCAATVPLLRMRGAVPDAITDTYFAFYTLAMGTGRTRSAARIAELVTAAGFDQVTIRPGPRPYITGLVLARK
jgi:demethylspheroidene O-methyltransferase